MLLYSSHSYFFFFVLAGFRIDGFSFSSFALAGDLAKPLDTLMLLKSPLLFTKVICRRGTVSGRINDFTTGGTVGADGKTGELAHNAADVNCVTNLALEILSLL